MEQNKVGALQKAADLVNKLLVKLGADEPQPVKLAASIKREDGVEIYTDADEFAVGVDVYVMDEEGNPQPAPDGEHVLETGAVAVVAEGKLVEIVEKEEEVAEEEEMSAYVKRSEFADFVKDLKEILSGANTELTEANKERAKLETQLSEMASKLEDINTKLSKVPAAKSTTKTKAEPKEPQITRAELAAMPQDVRKKYLIANPEASQLLRSNK